MADNTLIEWTDATWNPITGCSVVSPGCTNCYAMKLAGTRLKHVESRVGLTIDTKAGPVWNGQTRFNEAELLKPLRWKRPRRIFVCAHGDLFAESVPDEWIDRIFAVMALSPQHTFQVLTKRAERMRAYVSRSGRECTVQLAAFPFHQPAFQKGATNFGSIRYDTAEGTWHMPWPLPNVWLGVSAEDQARANERFPYLLTTPAAIRFVSAEPLLGPLDLDCPDVDWTQYPEGNGIRNNKLLFDWIIVGGESGQGARPMHPDWPRQIRDQCTEAGVSFFFKQWGTWAHKPEWAHLKDIIRDPWRRTSSLMEGARPALMIRLGKKEAGRLLDGIEHNAMPQVRA